MRRYRNKYNSHKVISPEGEHFDSEKEYRRYMTLRHMESDGHIRGLERQIPFTLSESVKDENGKTIMRGCVYKADFVYIDENNNLVVEDAKGFRTPEYIIKRKWMYDKHHILIQEV